MIDFIIRYGKYAPILTAVLLVLSAVIPPKRGTKWYGRYVFGAMGVVLLYATFHMMCRAR